MNFLLAHITCLNLRLLILIFACSNLATSATQKLFSDGCPTNTLCSLVNSIAARYLEAMVQNFGGAPLEPPFYEFTTGGCSSRKRSSLIRNINKQTQILYDYW